MKWNALVETTMSKKPSANGIASRCKSDLRAARLRDLRSKQYKQRKFKIVLLEVGVVVLNDPLKYGRS